MKRSNPTLKNKIRLYFTSIGEAFRGFVDSPYLISAIFFFMLIVMSGIAVLHKNEAKQLQDQLEIQKGHTNWFKMEAERNLNALNNCAIENKEKKRKLEEIKSILGFND